MGDGNHPSTTITWRITGFTRLTERKYYSDMFVVAGTKWRIVLYPKGNNTDDLSMYLAVAESNTLPDGWKRETQFSLSVVNQHNNNLSRKKEASNTFTSQSPDWGYRSILSLGDLHDVSGGFLVDDTIVVEAKVEVRSIHPPIAAGTLCVGTTAAAASTNRFDTYFASLEGLINDSTPSIAEGSVAQEIVTNIKKPSLEEVVQAKQSLKECLTDLFKVNMKERLAKALSTLSLSKDVLSPDQQKTVVLFWENFDEFTSDFLTFEQDNSEYELQQLLKNQLFRALEKNNKTHLLFKHLHGEYSKEEEECTKRLEDIRSKRDKVMADWDSLLVETEKLESSYKAQGKKVADAEGKKRITEERMSRSTTAWANLKRQFG